MQIKELYIYPIKSLRGISLQTSTLTPQGLQYDRRFMLRKVHPDGKFDNMHITNYPEMSLFRTQINTSTQEITISYQIPEIPIVQHHPDQTRTLTVPLNPEFTELEKVEVNMHQSPTSAYKMPAKFNEWFSNCFGFPVVLVYLGDSLRKALGSVSPNQKMKNQSSWLSYLPLSAKSRELDDGISFSDCAPFLVVSLASLKEIHPRLNEDGGKLEMDVRKFRPNVVLDGDAENPWDEDFWGELLVNSSAEISAVGDENGVEEKGESSVRIVLTANCGRCKSINIDYDTGKPGTGAAGSALKKLMKDRRVDKGVKYSPVFGRYGFLDGGLGKGGLGRVSVGDEVEVSKRNEERTTFEWPGLTS